MNTDAILDGLVRIGTVTDRNAASHSVRVFFPDVEITSGWLRCLQRPVSGSAATNGSHKHQAGEEETSEAGSHSHSVSVDAWTPAINDTVLCLFLPVQDGDGFVLGGI